MPSDTPPSPDPRLPAAVPPAAADRAAPPGPPALATLWVASCNLLNLALPERRYYPNQAPASRAEHERKIAWLGSMLGRLNADVVGVQEVWDLAALKAAVARSGLQYPQVIAPGTGQGLPGEPDHQPGAEGTPRVGLVTRLAVEAVQSVVDFAPAERVQVPELGEQARFERPVLHATLRTRHGQRLQVLVAHLKSKRPKFLQDAAGNALEERDESG